MVDVGAAVAYEETASFDALFEPEHRRLLRLAYLVAGDHHRAEDAVAEAFSRTYPVWRRGHHHAATSQDVPAGFVLFDATTERWHVGPSSPHAGRVAESPWVWDGERLVLPFVGLSSDEGDGAVGCCEPRIGLAYVPPR